MIIVQLAIFNEKFSRQRCGKKEQKEDAVDLLLEQIEVEKKIIDLYEKAARAVQSKPVRYLLHAIKFDSMKHIDICSTVPEILQDVLQEEKTNLREKLTEHEKLEKGSIDRANNLLKNIWIRENKALKELVTKLRDDEKRHTAALRKLADKTFFRWDPDDMTLPFRATETVDSRYRQAKVAKKHF